MHEKDWKDEIHKCSVKKLVARSAKKLARSAAVMAKQHRKQSAAMKRKPVVDR